MQRAAAGGSTVPGARLNGRRCLVTGAARGIGAAIAARFAGEGARVAVLDKDDAVRATVAELPAGPHPAVVADLADVDATRDAVEQAIDALGGIDVLVNNAGIFSLVPLLDITPAGWDEMLAVNARSMLVTTQVAARAMIAAGDGGRIVNVASMVAKQPAPHQAHYAASKAAVLALTQASALELGSHGITVNALCPGYVLTDMGAEQRTDDMIGGWSARSPLGRCGEPADVAGVAVFVASDDAAYCTGQAYNVTGGMIMH